MLFVCHPKILHKHCLQFPLGVKMAPRETENNAYAKFWRDKQRVLWYVMVFLEWSIPTQILISSKFMSILYHDSKHPFLRRKNTEEISSFDPKGKLNFLEIIRQIALPQKQNFTLFF